MSKSDKYLHIQADERQSLYVIGDVITVKLTAEDTHGAYLMVEVMSQPDGGPWFLHTHVPQETFHVVEGVFEIYAQDENGEKYAMRAEVGDTVHVPGNTPHGFKNVGTKPGRMILTYEPAENMLAFFEEVGVPMTDRTTMPDPKDLPDDATIMEILKKHLVIIEMP